MADKYTTAGSLMIKNMMPNDRLRGSYNEYGVLDKNGMRDLINLMVKDGDSKSFDTINRMAQMFFEKATSEGFTTTLSDYQNDSDERQAQLKEFEHKVNQITLGNDSQAEKYRKLDELAGVYKKTGEVENLKHLLSKNSTAAKMALTGARGNPMQLAQGSYSPLMAKDINGNPVPVAIKRSFAEGLSPAEHMATSYGGRSNTVMSQMSTALPGALFKQLTPNLFHEVVTETDCGTKNGVRKPVSDKHAVLGQYEAASNRLIDEDRYRDLKNSGTDQVKVRSTMTCEAKHGVCQHCYGLSATGKLPAIGENVGVIASQSVSEVLTQAVLGTKHTGGSAGKQRNPYEEAQNILRNPQNFQDEATLATLNGKVTEIRETALKDHEVFVNNVRHQVPRIQDVIVKKGQQVKKGDFLSTGTGNPRKMVDLKGIGPTRTYMSNQLRDIYGSGLDPKHFDLIARNLVKYGDVENPGNTGYLPGQTVQVNELQNTLKKDQKRVPVSQAQGQTLAEYVLEHTPGTVITENIVDDLVSAGVDSVRISKSGLSIKPKVPGLLTAKLYDPNWVSRLSFSKLKDTILSAAAEGAESDKSSTDPIASYVMGSDFGEGIGGKY